MVVATAQLPQDARFSHHARFLITPTNLHPPFASPPAYNTPLLRIQPSQLEVWRRGSVWISPGCFLELPIHGRSGEGETTYSTSVERDTPVEKISEIYERSGSLPYSAFHPDISRPFSFFGRSSFWRPARWLTSVPPNAISAPPVSPSYL